jgi:hypothetical protein
VDPEIEPPPDPCYDFYRTHKLGCSISHTDTISYLGETIETTAFEYDSYTIETYPFSAMSPCVSDVDCVTSGTITVNSYGFYTVEVILGVPTITEGPFDSLLEVWTLSNMAGMPDVFWVPGVDETEDDRPNFPEGCYPVWTVVRTEYDATYVGVHLTGSVAQAPVTRYETHTLGACGGGGGITIYDEYSDPVVCADFLADLVALSGDPTKYLAGGCEARYLCNECSLVWEAVVLRYRWHVPPCHTGSYYKIEWDELFLPKSYLDWYEAALISVDGIEVFDPNADPPPELPVLTPKTWTWGGAVLAECGVGMDDFNERYEMESRISPWSLPVLPTENGHTIIVNPVVWCVENNPFGNLPQPLDGQVFGTETFSLLDLDRDNILDENEPMPLP